MVVPDEDTFRKWKKAAAPMYDWMVNHHLVWPVLACRFGQREDAAEEGRYAQEVFYSEQVGPEDKVPNKLVYQKVTVCEEGYMPIDHVNTWKENSKSPSFNNTDKKVINHPGECNKIRCIHQKARMVVTHSDCEDVFLWDIDNISSKKKNSTKQSTPDLRLIGHKQQAAFALSTSMTAPAVASGGDDALVLIWNLLDHATDILGGSGGLGRKEGSTLTPRHTLKGHSAVVTDVVFKPGEDGLLASAGDDPVVKVWDTRAKTSTRDIPQTVNIIGLDWSHDGHYLATGHMDGSVRVFDLRGSANDALYEFGCLVIEPEDKNAGERECGMPAVSWNPRKPNYLLAGGNDGRVSVYDIARSTSKAEDDGLAPQLVLQHVGHVGNIQDAQWSPYDDFLAMSVSNDGDTYQEGGTVQMWRLSWLLTEEIQECENRLRQYQTWLESGKISDLNKPIEPPARKSTASADQTAAPDAEAEPTAAPGAEGASTKGGESAAQPEAAAAAAEATEALAAAADEAANGAADAPALAVAEAPGDGKPSSDPEEAGNGDAMETEQAPVETAGKGGEVAANDEGAGEKDAEDDAAPMETDQ